MSTTNRKAGWLSDPNYRNLEKHYVNRPIALYTGAGVSSSSDKKFGVGSWDDFVRDILKEKHVSAEVMRLFDAIEWANQPWEMAEWVAILVGRKAFKKSVMASIQKEDNFQNRYKLLSAEFLRKAVTLNAVAAFCAAFQDGGVAESETGDKVAVYEPVINRRVHAVVTSNYDPFLEAASSTMFRNPTLKPVAAQGSSVGTLNEIPVFHIHGYVPFPARFKKEEEEKRTPFLDPVVTKSDYDSAWRANDAYNYTMGPQIHILRHYTVLFIGFSFRDQWVNDLLRNLNTERRRRAEEEKRVGQKTRLYHYALMGKKEIRAKGEAFFDDIGVKPIGLESFTQIPNILGHLYGQALIHDHGEGMIELPLHQGRSKSKQYKPVSLTPGQYFEELCACRLCMVHKKKTGTLGPAEG